MADSGRPISPHVFMYDFPIVAVSSIMVRITGLLMTIGCAGLGTTELLMGSGSALSIVQAIGGVDSIIVTSGAKFSVSFSLIYHYFGALRHFVWDDKPELLTNVDTEKSSYAILGAAGVLSGLTLFF